MKKTRIVDTIQMLQFEGLSRYCNISHFTSTRAGGISLGNYAGFNLGTSCGDEPDAVRANRDTLCSWLGIPAERLFTPFQTHKDEVAILNTDFLFQSKKEQEEALHGIDALITNAPGLFVAVSTADCVPILLYDPKREVVAAVHAGWRSTTSSIATKVVGLMMRVFGSDPLNIRAGIGPSISKDAFEVGDEVGDIFQAIGMDMQAISSRHPGNNKLHIDLWEANRLQLLQAGLSPDHIETAGMCTYSQPDLFFSARRQGIHSGRMLSGIGIKNSCSPL